VLCEIVLEYAGLDIVGVAADPGNIDNAIRMVLFCEFRQQLEPAGIGAHTGAGSLEVLVGNRIER